MIFFSCIQSSCDSSSAITGKHGVKASVAENPPLVISYNRNSLKSLNSEPYVLVEVFNVCGPELRILYFHDCALPSDMGFNVDNSYMNLPNRTQGSQGDQKQYDIMLYCAVSYEVLTILFAVFCRY